MPNNLNQNEPINPVPEVPFNADSPADLFDQDGQFYALDERTEEEIDLQNEETREKRRLMPLVPGFFTDDKSQEILKRLERKTPGLLKMTATNRLMNDLRTYYLGKGECTYTTREEVLDENGKPVFRPNGEKETRVVKHTVPVTTFDQAMDLNNLPMEARQQIVHQFLTDLEEHPFGPDVDDATAEESARYYARIHKQAFDRIWSSPWPHYDAENPDELRQLDQGGSKTYLRASYAQDFLQNTEVFASNGFKKHHREKDRIRRAYLDEFGGVEELARSKDLQDLAQGLKTLAKVARNPQVFSLRQSALAKLYLVSYAGLMEGLNAYGSAGFTVGRGLEVISAGGFFSDVGLELPDEGAPTEEQLRDYLDGKINNPFSAQYIDLVDRMRRANSVKTSLDDQKDKIEVITKGTLDTDRIYDLSYVQIPHKVADAQGQMVDASQTMPDVRNLSEAQKRETEVIFDRSLGYLTSISQYGMQPYYATMKKERLMDRFRINGLKIMDYLAANGFPGIREHFAPPADADPARKAALLKESETAQKAALMTALADPNLSVTFVPYILDERERPVESAPIKITPKRDLLPDETRDIMTQLPVLPEDEGAKYAPGLGKHTVSFGMLLNLDPEIDLVGMQQDPQVKETLKNEPLLQDPKMKFMTPGTFDKRFYHNPVEDTVPGFDGLMYMKTILPTGAENVFRYSVVKGTKADGTLSEEGKKNLASVKSYMHAIADKTNALADSYEKESPVLSEHIRLYTDEMRTVEDGPVWVDLARDYAYSNLRAQTGGLGTINSIDIDSSSPQFMKDEFKAYTNYPTGEPSYRLPQAAEAARRQVLVRAEHERARREGVLSARQDRLTRRIILSELDELERDLRSIDTLTEKSRIAGSPEQAYVSMLENKEAGHRGYLDNNVYESSRYYPRGTRLVWMDMEAKRAMLANGWPLEDLNLLSHLYIRRAILQSKLSDTETREKKGEDWARLRERSVKVLDQIIGELERTPVRNAADRKRMLQMIDSYGSNFYTADIIDSDPVKIELFRKELRGAIEREPEALMFLSDEELADARAAYQRYQDRKNGPDPDRPTVNGPQTDIERAFLNTTRISVLCTMRGRLAGTRAFTRDQLHAQTLTQTEAFLSHVEEFYANTTFLSPEQQAARSSAFEALVRESVTLSEQIGKSIDRLTDNNRKKNYSEAEQKQLDALTSMQDQVRHMRSLYTAHIDLENRRTRDLPYVRQAELERETQRIAAEQEKHRVLEELETGESGREVLVTEDGEIYARLDYLMRNMLTDEEVQFLIDAYEGDIPTVLRVQDIDGRLLPRAVVDGHREKAARWEAALQAEQSRKSKERAERRKERQQEDFTEAAVDLFRQEEQKLMDSDPLKEESKRLAGEILEVRRNAKKQEAKRRVQDAERRERIEAIATDERYDEETRRALIEAIETEDRYDWEGNLKELKAQKRAVDEQLIEKYQGISRRRMQALDTGDERYTWSFRHILQDVFDRKTAAKQAYQDAKGTPESVPEITRKGILAYDEEKRYDRMMSIVGAALDPDKLREALRVKWPEWSAQVLDPLLTGKSGAKMTGVIIDRMKATLPPGEAHAFLDEQLRAQREDIREDARRNLLTLQLVTELPEEEQVSHLLHERVEELKRKGLVDDAGHLLDERGVPYPPEVEQGEILKDESGIPYPPESPVLQAYQRRKAYREALEYADRVVTQTGELAVAGNIAHRKIEESARSEELKRDVREGIAAYPEEEMRTVANNLLKNGTSFVADGVQPGQEEYRDRILNTTYDFSQEHLGKIAGMLKMMEEMQLPVGNDMPGGTGANRAYSVLLDAREMLRQAVVAGDEEWILQAKADYEKAKKDIDTLNAYAQDEANFPAESIPGNIDSTRDRNLPLEYSRDYYTNSKLNAMHNLYSVMKWAGIPIARLTEDPNAVIRDLYRKVAEEFDLNKQSEGKSFGTLLGEMASEDIEKHSFKLARCSGMQDLVSRCVDAIIMMDPDPNARKKNELTESLQSTYQNRLLGHRSSYNNPKKDPARWDDVQQLLSLVDEETFAKNPAKFLMIRPLDDHGFPEQPTTAASFVAGIGEDFFGYPGLMNRAEEILTDAGHLAGSQFDPVRFMQNRQKALSTLLIARAADRYKVGFSVLEDEILHMADYYESIRQANPDAKLPALTEAERQSFTVQAAQFAENMENAYRSLSDDAKEMVDMRRDARQEEEEAYRESGTIIPTDHRERVLWEMDQLGIRPAARPQQNGPVPPVPPVQADPGQRGPAVIVPPVQEVPGSVAADGAGEKAPMGALATQLEKNFLTNYEAVHLDSAMTAQGFENSEPEQYYDSVIDMYDAETRFRYLYVAIRNDYDKDRLALALIETYGMTEGMQLFARIGSKVPQPIDLFRISGEDRRKLFGAMAGYLPLERQEELLAADKEFRPIREIDTSSEITPETDDKVRAQFEAQVDHPASERVKNLLDEAGLDWKKMSGGKGTKEELDAFREDLADADALLAEVKSELKDRVEQVRGAQAKRDTRRYNLVHRKGNEKPENRYLQDLFVTEKDVKVSREDRQADLKRTARSNPHFDKDYIRNVAAMLHRMQEMHLLSNETRSEEQFKVYAFRDIVLARAALRDALAADMTVEENRKKLAEAVKRLKTAQKGMDELIRMAKENFSQTGYMDNLDTSRNVAVPWQYSRNLVTTSQVNAVWMFGNLLLQNGISIEEFEKDPDRVIERLKTHALEEGATLKGVTRGKSMGEIAVLGATNYFDGQLVEANNRLLGQYSRGVDGLIEGDPADNTPNKEHNQYLYMQNIYGYATNLHHAARKNAKRLTEGFQGRSREGFEAIKTLTVVAPEDFDPDGMLLKVPVNTDGSRREPFRLGNYLRDKDKIDYQAQIGRLDRMLEDAAKTYQRICREEETENMQPTGKYPGVVGGALRTERYTPFPLVQARQQALAEMLALRPEDASDPAYAQLEDEVLNAAQKYDALRKARPELNLPELTGEQKKTLEEQKKNYLNIRNNREKLMGRIEDRMAKGVRQEEKTFNTQAKSLADQIRKLKERIGRREAKIAQAEEKIRRAAQGGNDRRRQAAVSEKEALEREKRTFDEQLAGLEQSLESLRVDRMKTLTAQYRDGKLPYGYVDKRLRQIDEGREQEELPKLFGDPHNNEEDREARKTFLNDKIFEESGTDLDTKPDKVDHPLNWTIWNHTFWTEEEKAAVDLGNQEEVISPEETEEFVTEEQEISSTNEEIRQEVPKEEAPKQEVPKQEAPKEEAPKQNPPEQVQNPPEPQNNAVNDEERQREKIETLMKYPPKRRALNVHAPVRHSGSGEILIRSHDMDPSKGDFDPGDETLPREILNTGDLEMLRLYREIYRESLLTLPDGAMYVEYLDQRIAGLEKIDRVMKEIDQKTRQGQITYSPVATTAQDGTITVQGARQREFQTASNGCWSVALSNLLDSRGVSLTQKDIRSFRATKPFTSYANANDTNEYNNDIGSDPFHDSELVMKTVPNTAMHFWGFEEMPPAQVDKNGAIYRDATDDTAVKAIREQVEYALRHDCSPVAIKYGGHYQTIVGIKGNTLILRDSLKPSEKECTDEKGIYHEPNPNRTIRIDLYDVVRKVRRQAPGYPRDLSLVWLSELHKDPVTGEVEETKHYPNLKFQADGKLTQTQEPDGNTVMLEGTADTGCWSVAMGEKEGLRPVYQVKFPNEIRMDLLRKAEKPSRTPAQHLTIPDAKPSAKRGQIVDYMPGRRPGEVSEGAGEFLGGEGTFWNKEDGNALLFGMIAQVCYDKQGNLIKGIQMVADSAYSVTNEAQGHLFAQNLIQAIQAVPSAQRSDAQELALDLARDRLNAWKPAEQVRDISIDDVYRKTYGNLPPKGTGSTHHRTAQQIPGQNTAGTTHENKPGGMQNRK